MSKKTVDERLADRLAEIGAEAEAGEEDQISRPMPEHVKVTRGNARNKVLQVRLNPDEYAAIERIARGRRLPPSTVAREALLGLIDNSPLQDPFTTLVALADRIKAIAVDVSNDYPQLDERRRRARRTREKLARNQRFRVKALADFQGRKIASINENIETGQVFIEFTDGTVLLSDPGAAIVRTQEGSASQSEDRN